ncbi:MAG TPA: hypothetical protein VLD57_11685 [Blastocatellia bacterium]|nr:hypothetical protein [Blastocatellia bacterium]
MNIKSKLLIISIFNLLAFAFTAPCFAQSAISDGEAVAFDLSKIDEGVIKEFGKAWLSSRSGTAYVEGLVLIFRNRDDSYRAGALAPSPEFEKFTFKWVPGVIAIAHTHPTNCNPRPAAQDIRVADRYRVPILTITRWGMYMYNPSTKKITKVHDNLDWLSASKWGRT